VTKKKIYGEVKGPYTQSSIIKRIEALFLDNIGKILTREQIIESAVDPLTGREPENWHQRLWQGKKEVTNGRSTRTCESCCEKC